MAMLGATRRPIPTQPGGPGGPTPPPPCNQSNNFCNTGHGGNPGGPSQRKTQVKLGGCNDRCENDKLLIQQYIQNERTKEEAINSTVGTILSLMADIFAAAADFAAEAFGAFIIDVATIAGHLLILLTDLNNIGLISIPSWLVTLSDAFQNVLPWLVAAKGFVQWFGLGPAAGIANGVINAAKLQAQAGLMSMVSSLSSATLGFSNDVLDWTKYNGTLAVVDGYNSQTAYTICQQDYSSDPGRC